MMKKSSLALTATMVMALSTTTFATIEVHCPTYKQMNSAFRYNHDCKVDGYCAKKINGHSFQIAAKNCSDNCEFKGFDELKGAFLHNNYLHCEYGSTSDTEWQSSSTYQIGENCTVVCNTSEEGILSNNKTCIATCEKEKVIDIPKED